MDSYSRLHEHAIFGVVSVSDTCWTPERVRLAGFRCPASVLFFFRFSDTVPTRLWRVRHASSEEKENTGVFKLISEFRRIPVCFGGKLVPGQYKMNEFFFSWVFSVLTIFIFGVLDDHDSPNFSLQDHPSLLLPPFNRADGLGGLSFLFLFSFQRATPCFLYILERQSPIF